MRLLFILIIFLMCAQINEHARWKYATTNIFKKIQMRPLYLKSRQPLFQIFLDSEYFILIFDVRAFFIRRNLLFGVSPMFMYATITYA